MLYMCNVFYTVSDISGSYVSLLLQNVTVTMTSVSGHLLGLEFKAPFQKWLVKTGFFSIFVYLYAVSYYVI